MVVAAPMPAFCERQAMMAHHAGRRPARNIADISGHDLTIRVNGGEVSRRAS